MSRASQGRRRPGPGKTARNAAIAALRRFGLSPTELTRLDLADIDRESRTLRLRGKPPESLPLPQDILELLEVWCGFRGDKAGPLFTSMRKGGAAFTAAGMKLILPRIAGEETELRADARKPVAERRAMRNRVLALLYEAGVGPRELTTMRIEDLREEGVEVGGSRLQLPESTLVELRQWREQLNRRTGPMFVALMGSARGMTEAGVRLILKNSGNWRPARISAMDRSFDAIQALWRRLPVELRRRSPRGREVAMVAYWVQEACDCGADLDEALRIAGLTPEQFRLACEEISLSEGLKAIQGGDGDEISRVYTQGFKKHRWFDMGIDPNGG